MKFYGIKYMNTKKTAFTLAEVLITLMIIGVVAVLTIPNLLQAIEDKDKQVAFKKSVAILSEAIQQITAREVGCNDIEDNDDLAECFSNVYLTGTLNKNVLTANDGMVYVFFWRKGEKGDFSGCGEKPLNTKENWEGSDANCVVVVDIDGFNKGAIGVNDLSAKAAITEPAGTEQFPLVISLHGVRPAFYEGSLGYKYLYGTEVDLDNVPWETSH